MENHKEIDKWGRILNIIRGHARQYHIAKLRRIDNILKGVNATEEEVEVLHGWRRDDSFLGIPAANEIEYKLGYPLISLDGTRAYEFVIEFSINDPNVGIYYGVKGLTLKGDHYDQIDSFVKDFWGMGMEDLIKHGINKNDECPQKAKRNKCPKNKVETVRDLIAKYLNATFPGKDFSQRFMFTDNAWDHTFWPFWIASEPEEDIVWETARAVSIIRRIYKERADSRRSLYELTDSDCPISEVCKKMLMGIGEVGCAEKKLVEQQPEYPAVRKEYVQTIRFTNQAYRSIIEKLENDYNRRFFEQLLVDLTIPNPELSGSIILKQSTLLEKGFVIEKRHNRRLFSIMRLFFEKLTDGKNQPMEEYAKVSRFFDDLTTILLPYDGYILNPKTMFNRANEIVVQRNKDDQSHKSGDEKERQKLSKIICIAMAKTKAKIDGKIY